VPTCASGERLARCEVGQQRAEAVMKKRIASKSKLASTIHIGKWTVKIVSVLHDRPQRYGQLRRRLGSISQRMLTKNLRDLESAGLIARHVTKSRSIAVEYSLTRMGKTFVVPLTNICDWARQRHKQISATIRLLEPHSERT
jgi:DNA-binding HxlR family transcriptional regulator